MRTVRIVYHNDDGAWWAESPEIDGYTAAGGSLDDVRKLVIEGVPFFLGEQVLFSESVASSQPA